MNLTVRPSLERIGNELETAVWHAAVNKQQIAKGATEMQNPISDYRLNQYRLESLGNEMVGKRPFASLKLITTTLLTLSLVAGILFVL